MQEGCVCEGALFVLCLLRGNSFVLLPYSLFCAFDFQISVVLVAFLQPFSPDLSFYDIHSSLPAVVDVFCLLEREEKN